MGRREAIGNESDRASQAVESSMPELGEDWEDVMCGRVDKNNLGLITRGAREFF